MRRRNGLAILVAGIGLLVSGCIDLEYVGQEFEATPMSRPVALFQNRTEVPPGEYRIIGRATLTAPDGMLGYDIQEKLLDTAREAGADAVCLVSTKRVNVGTYQIENSSFSPPGTLRLNPGNRSADGSMREINTFGSRASSVRGEERSRIEIVVKALYLKNRKELARILAERGRELEELEELGGEPALPVSGTASTAEEKPAEETASKEEKNSSGEAVVEKPIPQLSPAEKNGVPNEAVPAQPAAIPEDPAKAVTPVSATE